MEPPTGLIPWFSKTEGNTYTALLHHPFLFKGKPTQCSRGSKKDFWRRCGGGLCTSQDIPSTHHKLFSLALHYLPFASRFPLPHFTLAVLFSLSFPSASLFRPLLVFSATMSETGEVIVDKDNSNNMGNFDAFDDPAKELTILHTKKFRISSGNIIGKGSYSRFLYLCMCFAHHERVYSS